MFELSLVVLKNVLLATLNLVTGEKVQRHEKLFYPQYKSDGIKTNSSNPSPTGWLAEQGVHATDMPRVAASCSKPQQTNPPTKKKIKQTNKLRSNNEKPHEKYVSQAFLNLA